MTYTSLDTLHGLDEPVDYGAGVEHARRLLERYPEAELQVGLWLVDQLERINAGALDGQIDRLARWIQDARRRVYLRIGYEFDLPENRYEPEAYVRGYRRIAERLRPLAAAQAVFVWHSYASVEHHPLKAWYPGDDAVDWCGVSYFDQERAALEPMAAFARAHRKPLMIAEATPRGIGTGDTARWLAWWAACRRYIEDANVSMLSYINNDWEALPMFRGQGWGDSRVEANAAVQAAWLADLVRLGFLP